VAVILLALVAAGIFTLRDIRLASSQTVSLVAWRAPAPVPVDDPGANVWKRSAPVEIALSAQNLVPPMASGEGTATARALHDGSRVYVRLEWGDDVADTSTADQTSFSDAAAVQFPVSEGEQVPPFCMGDPDAPVNIWQWKASWQQEGDEDAASPDQYADLYPFEDEEVFYPPRAAGNIPARVDRVTPVDNLLAGSFGTLTPAEDQMVQGRGEWDDGRWRVVFARDLAVDGDYTQFEVGGRTNVAFAVWDGDQGERDGMKSVSQFLTLEVSPDEAPAGAGISLPRGAVAAIIAAGLALVLATGLGLTLLARRSGRGT
jgi:hypothetical protein